MLKKKREKLKKASRNLLSKLLKLHSNEENHIRMNILITSTDGIGDFIVREKIFLEIIKRYSIENIHVLVKKGVKDLVKKYGVLDENIHEYTKDDVKKISKSYSFFKRIKKLNLLEVYSLEMSLHDLWFIEYLKNVKKICFKFPDNSQKEMYNIYDKVITGDFRGLTKILEYIKSNLEEFTGKKYKLEEIIPNVENKYKKLEKYQGIIAVGVGSADRKKIMAPKSLEKILLEINKKYSNRKIILLGIGHLEERIAKEMLKIDREKNIINLIGKTTFDESMDIINSSSLYIGMDSGLYNMAFAMNKKTIGLFSRKDAIFAHTCSKNLNIVTGENSFKSLEDNEEYFGDSALNNIEVEKVLDAINEFLGD